MSRTRVVVLYNEPVLPVGHADAESEHEILSTVAFVEECLRDTCFEIRRLPVDANPASLFAGLKELQPDVVFNLYEGTALAGETEAYVAAALEWLRIPFTGSPSIAIALSRAKHTAKTLLQGAGLPTPAFCLVDGGAVPPNELRWPVIVKLATEHASVGLDQSSVVTDQQALDRRVQLLRQSYGLPVLVEEYVEGREFNVALIENPDLLVLPLAEIEFTHETREHWPIVTYTAKWHEQSYEYQRTMPRCPARVDPALCHRLEVMSQKAFRLLGCRDYARIDFRVSPGGLPTILEVNPNPDYHPSSGLTRTLEAAGLCHAKFTVELVESALARRIG